MAFVAPVQVRTSYRAAAKACRPRPRGSLICCGSQPGDGGARGARDLLATLQRHSQRTAAAGMAAALIAGTPFLPTAGPASALTPPLLDREHDVVEEVWSLVERYYIDPAYHGVDWASLHDELMSKPLRSRSETYATLRGALGKLDDRYTRILQPEDMARLRKYDVSGVGLLLTANAAGELAVASEPPPASSAAKAGVRRGDVILAVDGESLEGRGAFRAAELMQGDDGTTMRVELRRPSDGGASREVVLVRKFSGSGGAQVRWSLQKVADRPVGYIKLADFSAGSRGEVERALAELDAAGATAYVLDMRGNPGGVFEGALEIAGLFEGRGAVVARVESRSGRDEVFRSRVVSGGAYAGGASVPPDAPVAVLVDSGSASSSEVLGGGLRDACRAAIAGAGNTYGKGLIQGVFGLSDGGGVVVTVASYRTPNGDAIQGRGLAPSVALHNSPVDKLARAAHGDGPAAMVDFDAVERDLRMCRDRAARP